MKDFKDLASTEAYLQQVQDALMQLSSREVLATVHELYRAWREHKQVFILGNGGSASTASHMANDLSKATIVAGKHRMKVLSLTDNVALITAWANDDSYASVFRQQLENLLDPGDVVLGISASGNSENVLEAMEYARSCRAVTIGWTGLSGGKLKDVADICLHAPTDDVGMIESLHLVLDHLVANQVFRRIAESDAPKIEVSRAFGAAPGRAPKVMPLADSSH